MHPHLQVCHHDVEGLSAEQVAAWRSTLGSEVVLAGMLSHIHLSAWGLLPDEREEGGGGVEAGRGGRKGTPGTPFGADMEEVWGLDCVCNVVLDVLWPACDDVIDDESSRRRDGKAAAAEALLARPLLRPAIAAVIEVLPQVVRGAVEVVRDKAGRQVDEGIRVMYRCECVCVCAEGGREGVGGGLVGVERPRPVQWG
jgi:hypothetical protein